MSNRLVNAAALTLLVLIWGTTWAAVRLGLQGIPPFLGISLRFAIASIILLVVARLRGVRLRGSPREWTMWAVNGLLAFSISYGVVYSAQQWIPSGLAAVLFATFPLFVAILAHFVLPGEKLRLRSVLGILLGLAGLATIFSEDLVALSGQQARGAAALFLISPAVSAVANVIVKRWGREIHPLSLTAVPMGLTAVLMGLMAGLFERTAPPTFDRVSVGALLYLAGFGTALAFCVFFFLLRRLPVTRLSLITYGIPIVAVTVGTLFMAEPLTWKIVTGTALVLLGVLLAVRSGRAAAPTLQRSAQADQA